jgi:hypothetical protein
MKPENNEQLKQKLTCMVQDLATLLSDRLDAQTANGLFASDAIEKLIEEINTIK